MEEIKDTPVVTPDTFPADWVAPAHKKEHERAMQKKMAEDMDRPVRIRFRHRRNFFSQALTYLSQPTPNRHAQDIYRTWLNNQQKGMSRGCLKLHDPAGFTRMFPWHEIIHMEIVPEGSM